MNIVSKDYEHISQIILPQYFLEFSKRILNPIPMENFYKKGVGESFIFKTIKNHYKLNSKIDFSGCYVFIEGETNQYVGISKKIPTRIRQHLKGVTHYHSSLAYLMAKNNLDLGLRRDVSMENKNFIAEFRKAQKKISTWGLSVIEIVDPVELYLFEVYASLKLNTIYNSFETH
ncbi:GIY-YIG nuclease family protein (plasmid) [Leptospira sp. WS92.C1]